METEKNRDTGSKSLAETGYVMGIDIGKDRDYCAVQCLKCKKNIDIEEGNLPLVGWCGCVNSAQEIT